MFCIYSKLNKIATGCAINYITKNNIYKQYDKTILTSLFLIEPLIEQTIYSIFTLLRLFSSGKGRFVHCYSLLIESL